MDIKITHKSLQKFLKTSLSPEEIAQQISLCGPTFDRVHLEGDEVVFDIEVITNRIDTASAQGIARDAAAILHQQNIKAEFVNDPYKEKIDLYTKLPKNISFQIENQDLVPRFTAVALENISIKDSSEETKTLLTLCGERPINNAVDITNELTLLYGMPSHIFDLDKLGLQKLLIRESRSGETVSTLDGQKNTLAKGDIVIEDGTGQLVDLCGIMGGSVAEVDQYTKNILLIVPTYKPASIRKTSLRLQKRTLASQIYEKEPDPELCLPVLMKAIELFQKRANARVSSAVFNSQTKEFKPKTIQIDFDWINNLIGTNISQTVIISILQNLGFSVSGISETKLVCKIPSWRDKDINIKEDLVEEIARVYGYYTLPSVLPCTNLSPEPKNPILSTETKIKELLSSMGFNEVYNSSLVSHSLIINTCLNPDNHLKLKNALSTDYEYLRTSLVPSILQNIKNNQGKSSEPFRLFEVSNTYHQTSAKLPEERSNLTFVSTEDFRQTKGVLESLMHYLHVRNLRFSPTTKCPSYFAPSQTASVSAGNTLLGFLGIIRPEVLHQLGVSSSPVVAEIGIKQLTDNVERQFSYTPLPEFPAIIETVTITSNKPVGDLMHELQAASPLINEVSFVESFKKKHTFVLSFISTKKNLTQLEVNDEKNKVLKLFS